MVFFILIFLQRPQILNPLQHKDTIVTRLMFGNKNPRNFSNFKTLATFMNQAPPINNNVEGTCKKSARSQAISIKIDCVGI